MDSPSRSTGSTVVGSPQYFNQNGSPGGQSATGTVDATGIQIPAELEVRARLQQVAHIVENQHRPNSSGIIYEKVYNEWKAYCEHVVNLHEGSSIYHLNAHKVFNFMFFQVFRCQKQRGGRAGGGMGTFDPLDYNAVIQQYSSYMRDNPGTIPDPERPIGKAAISQYRAALRKLHAWEVNSNETSLTWDFVLTDQTKRLVKIAETRTARKKENYKEKVNKMFTPYQAVEQFDVIEKEMWVRGSRHARSTGCWLRNRYVFLHTTASILRCKSLYRAKLSDFLGVFVKNTDIHPVFIMVTQIPEGNIFLQRNFELQVLKLPN